MTKGVVFVLFALMLGSHSLHAQRCCAKPGDMSAVLTSADFVASHLPPLPFKYTSVNGSMVQFNTSDGTPARAYYVPADKATNKVLIIFHEWWGLNDYIKREAEKWQKMLDGVDVYAVDLYDGKVTRNPDSASVLASDLDHKRADDIIQSLLRYAGQDKQVATLGWCMGGSWSFRATVLAGNQAAACVMYYGFPEKEDYLIKPQCDVLYILGTQDKFIKKPFVDEFGNKIKATQHNFTLYTYDADHAFANPSNPSYNALAATKAQNVTLKFLKDKLQLQ
jgi:carboxymethylenebutenolidase